MGDTCAQAGCYHLSEFRHIAKIMIMMMMIDTSWRHEKKKRSNKKNNNPPSSHLSLRHTISAVAFCGMYFYKRERKRGRENHAVRSHFDSHPHYDKSAVIKLRVSFSVFFCFPTLSRVPHFERAGNKKEKKEDELRGS